LEDIRLREFRSKSGPLGPPPGEPHDEADPRPATIPVELLRVGDAAASWHHPLALKVIGTAAAQTRGCVVDIAEMPRDALFPPGGAVLIVADGLAPLARPGQWALLAEHTVRLADGDYAAVVDQAGNHYLRRVWSAGDAWLLEAINPLAGKAPVRVRKCVCLARKVIGISYESPKEPRLGTTRLAKEWHTRQDFSNPLEDAYGVTIRGTSLEPIACDGHVIVVGRKIGLRFDAVRRGALAIVETDDPHVGNVIKRVYPEDRSWLLLSPNSVDPRDPLIVSKANLRGVWPVQGVLLELSIREE
jgi:Peptidase S24-like